ncbi:MAG: ABC transporter substrate-binding protein [Candidatus Wallbacteria bacterium]|nr:ABC transporter substrate-binding protein [Candidatus Wallbacteria bacterium]
MKQWFFFLFATVSMIFITGCDFNPRESQSRPAATSTAELQVDNSPSYGDTLVICSEDPPKTLDTAVIEDEISQQIQSLIFSSLLKMDRNDRVCGDLAAAWEVSADKKSISFRLRPHIRCHDGSNFTAEDVRYFFDRVMHRNPDAITISMQNLETVEVSGLSVTFKFKTPCQEIPELATAGIIPRSSLSKEGSCEVLSVPSGTGPFMLKEWVQGDHMLLQYFDDYINGRPYLNGIMFKFIPDPTAAFLALKQGEIDFMRIYPDQYLKQCDEAVRKRYRLIPVPIRRGYRSIAYNCSRPLLSSPTVRKALTMAADRNAILADAFQGCGGTLISGPFPPDSWPCDSTVRPLPYDTAEALNLLNSEGITDSDGDGLLEWHGNKVPLRYVSAASGGKGSPISLSLCKAWKEIGFDVKLDVVPYNDLLEITRSGNFDFVEDAFAYSNTYSLKERWYSSATPQNGGFNYSRYSSPRADAIIDSLETVSDESVQVKLYHDFHRILAEDQPALFLCPLERTYVVDCRFREFSAPLDSMLDDLSHCYVPEEMQKR